MTDLGVSTKEGRSDEPHVVIVVLGDIGRSPRMQFHALAFAKNGWRVTLLGYSGESLLQTLETSSLVRVRHLWNPVFSKLPYLLSGPLRLLVLSFQLKIQLLFLIWNWDLVLTQSPPAVPTLPIAWLATRIRSLLARSRKRFIVDWHNLGYARFSEKVGADSLAVRIYRRIEEQFGSWADGQLCVSRQMKGYLEKERGAQDVHVLYDRPLQEQIDSASQLNRAQWLARFSDGSQIDANEALLLISSTSWSDDEDPTMLLNSARRLESYYDSIDARGIQMMIVITGKGPNRRSFEEQVASSAFNHIAFRTGWFTVDEYRGLLNSADVGICLHLSASGIDLPMKLADMLGAALPTLCFNYGETLKERFVEGQHGFLFVSENDLFEQLLNLAKERASSRLGSMRRMESDDPIESWESGWIREALPLFQST